MNDTNLVAALRRVGTPLRMQAAAEIERLSTELEACRERLREIDDWLGSAHLREASPQPSTLGEEESR